MVPNMKQEIPVIEKIEKIIYTQSLYIQGVWGAFH